MGRPAAGGLRRPAGRGPGVLTGSSPSILPAPASDVVADLIARLDRGVPDRIEGFYVVGSVAMGAFVPGRSDVDFVAIVDGPLDRGELARLRALHLGRWTVSLIRDLVLERRWPLVCNGVYLRSGDLAKSPLEVTPLAGHVSGRFRIAPRRGFDVNPITWHVLARHGIAIRGPEPDRLQIHADPAELRRWTAGNLNDYWRRWVAGARRGGPGRAALLGRRYTAAGVLGASRLHYTIATGEVTTKEAAGRYALETFDARWHALIDDALAYWSGASPAQQYRGRPDRRRRDSAEFVSSVINAGNALATQPEIL